MLAKTRNKKLGRKLKSDIQTQPNESDVNVKKVQDSRDKITTEEQKRLEKERFDIAVKDRVSYFCDSNRLDKCYNIVKKYAEVKMSNDENYKWEKDIYQNPYKLMKVEGNGFISADKVAMGLNFPLDHKYRILAFVSKALDDNSKGSTILPLGDILVYMGKELKIGDNSRIVDVVLNQSDNTYLMLTKEYKRTTDIMLARFLTKTSWFEMERGFFNLLKELEKEPTMKLNMDIVNKVKCSFEYRLNTGQDKAINEILKSNINVLTGLGGCLPNYTEVLTDKGWIQISDWKDEEIMEIEFDENKKLKGGLKGVFRKPLHFHQLPVSQFYRMKNKVGSMNLVSSEEHKHPSISAKGFCRNFTTKDLFEKWENTPTEKTRPIVNIPETFEWFGEGIDYTDDYIRLKVAVFADGSFIKKNNTCYFNVKKQRKKTRIEELLKRNNIDYSIGVSGVGYNRYRFTMDNKDKEFDLGWFYKTNKRQREIIFDEIKHWDGSINTGNRLFTYTTTKKICATVIQLIATSLGYRSTIYQDKRTHKYVSGECYDVTFSSNKFKTRTFEKSECNIFEKIDCGDLMYCFTTSTGYFLIRQNGNIYVTGNSGKSTITKAILSILSKHRQSYTALAPTGIASKNFTKLTGAKCETVHRRFFSKGKIESDWLILEESSMLACEHIKMILSMLGDNKPRLLFIGDLNQLSPINPSAPFRDLFSLIEKGKVKGSVVELTEIMRASNDSFIPHLSRMFTKYGNYDKSVENKEHAGVYFYKLNKDLPKQILSLIGEHNLNFKNTYVLSPQKVGDFGCTKLNEYLNEVIADNTILYKDKFKTLRVNSEMLQDKNNKDLDIYNGERVTLKRKEYRNGNTYYICDRLDEGTEIIYDEDVLLNQVILSYGLTVHKTQSLTVENIILICSSQHYHMLTTNLVYTGMSRASKKLIIIHDEGVLARASRKTEIDKRTTFLGEISKR